MLRILSLAGFDGRRCLIHDPKGILSGKYGEPNQVESLDETLVHLTDLSTIAQAERLFAAERQQRIDRSRRAGGKKRCQENRSQQNQRCDSDGDRISWFDSIQ